NSPRLETPHSRRAGPAPPSAIWPILERGEAPPIPSLWPRRSACRGPGGRSDGVGVDADNQRHGTSVGLRGVNPVAARLLGLVQGGVGGCEKVGPVATLTDGDAEGSRGWQWGTATDVEGARRDRGAHPLGDLDRLPQ